MPGRCGRAPSFWRTGSDKAIERKLQAKGHEWQASCGASPTVRIPDEPGSRLVTPESSWILNLKIEVLVTSGADPVCKRVCKYQQRKLTLTVKLRVKGGQPDRSFESIGVRTE